MLSFGKTLQRWIVFGKTAVLQQILLGLGIEMDDFGMEEQMREVMKKHIEEQV